MPSQAKNTVLITGGAGFIGSYLCERFLELGRNVICLDNFYTGNIENVRHLLDHQRFELVRHDITEPYLAEVGLIMNFACPASPVHYQGNPIKTMKTSVIGTMNMLGLAKRVGATLLQASTSEVYGDPQVHPQPETYWGNVNPIGPRSCYDEGKRAAETLCYDYKEQHGVDTRLVRIFNTYGPRMAADDGRVVSNFIVQALQGKPLTIYGEGSQTRSFCFVDDLVDIIMKAALGEPYDGAFNIGNPNEFTIGELAQLVKKQVGDSVEITKLELPKDDPKVRRPDLTKTKEHFGWEPKIQLEEGLKKTIEYFRTQV